MNTPSLPENGPKPKPRILIIEDYAHTREGLARLFRRHGWEPDAVADAVEARRYIHSSVQSPPDVYLIDLRLPGAPGPLIIQIIRLANHRSRSTGLPVRIVAFTCLDGADPQVQEAIAAGADAVAFKTADIDHLIAIVEGNHPGDVPIPSSPRKQTVFVDPPRSADGTKTYT